MPFRRALDVLLRGGADASTGRYRFTGERRGNPLNGGARPAVRQERRMIGSPKAERPLAERVHVPDLGAPLFQMSRTQ